MKRNASYIGVLTAIPLMVGLPLLGLWSTGRLSPHHFEFPPITHYIAHAPFSWPAFISMAAAIIACCLPVILRITHRPTPHSPQSTVHFPQSTPHPPQSTVHFPQSTPHSPHSPFPLWGWAGVCFTAATWVLAWTRFAWAAPIQGHTFFPLWMGYIVVISALTWRRKGSCMLTARPVQMLALFTVSALFWWYFEYLNRFVQNWFYFGVTDFSSLRYFWFATLPFATVLPAVLATAEWLETFPRLMAGLQNWHPVTLPHRRRLASAWLCAGTLSLFAIGLVPSLLYPMLWLSPLILITALQTLAGAPTLFTPLREGNWHRIVCVATAALICGFFWEMWNFRSAAGWTYAVPFVGRFKIFEMPVLGYAGYLPFGLECAVIADLVMGENRQND